MKKLYFILFLFLTSTTFAGIPINYPNIIGIWDFDANSSTSIAHDKTGQNADGTVHGTPTFNSYGINFGGIGSASVYDYNTNWISIPNSSILNPTSITIVIRKRITQEMTTEQGQFTPLMKMWDSSAKTPPLFSYALGISNAQYSGIGQNRTLFWCIENGVADLVTDAFPFPLSTTQHTLICTYDSVNHISTLWLDKTHMATRAMPSINITGSTGDLLIGTQYCDDVIYGSYGHNWGDEGEISEIALINGAIDQATAYAICDLFGNNYNTSLQCVDIQGVSFQ